MNYNGKHVRLRMQQRGITQQRADQCIENSTASRMQGRDTYDDGEIKVIVNHRTKSVITVLTKDVTLLYDVPFLGGPVYQRLHAQTGAFVWYDKGTNVHEVHASGRALERAQTYLLTMARRLEGIYRVLPCGAE